MICFSIMVTTETCAVTSASMRRKNVVFIINQFIRNIVVGPPKTEKLLIVKKRFYKKSQKQSPGGVL